MNSPIYQEFEQNQRQRPPLPFPLTNNHKIFGIRIGTVEHRKEEVTRLYKNIQAYANLLREQDPRIRLQLTKYCINSMATFYHRIETLDIIRPDIHDGIVDSLLASIVDVRHLPEISQQIRAQPTQRGGLGIPRQQGANTLINQDSLLNRVRSWLTHKGKSPTEESAAEERSDHPDPRREGEERTRQRQPEEEEGEEGGEDRRERRDPQGREESPSQEETEEQEREIRQQQQEEETKTENGEEGKEEIKEESNDREDNEEVHNRRDGRETEREEREEREQGEEETRPNERQRDRGHQHQTPRRRGREEEDGYDYWITQCKELPTERETLRTLGYENGLRDESTPQTRKARMSKLEYNALINNLRRQAPTTAHALWLDASSYKGSGALFQAGSSYLRMFDNRQRLFPELIKMRLLLSHSQLPTRETPGELYCERCLRTNLPNPEIALDYHGLSCTHFQKERIQRHDRIVEAFKKYLRKLVPAGTEIDTNPFVDRHRNNKGDCGFHWDGAYYCFDIHIVNPISPELAENLHRHNRPVDSTEAATMAFQRKYKKFSSLRGAVRKVSPLTWLATGRESKELAYIRKDLESLIPGHDPAEMKRWWTILQGEVATICQFHTAFVRSWGPTFSRDRRRLATLQGANRRRREAANEAANNPDRYRRLATGPLGDGMSMVRTRYVERDGTLSAPTMTNVNTPARELDDRTGHNTRGPGQAGGRIRRTTTRNRGEANAVRTPNRTRNRPQQAERTRTNTNSRRRPNEERTGTGNSQPAERTTGTTSRSTEDRNSTGTSQTANRRSERRRGQRRDAREAGLQQDSPRREATQKDGAPPRQRARRGGTPTSASNPRALLETGANVIAIPPSEESVQSSESAMQETPRRRERRLEELYLETTPRREAPPSLTNAGHDDLEQNLANIPMAPYSRGIDLLQPGGAEEEGPAPTTTGRTRRTRACNQRKNRRDGDFTSDSERSEESDGGPSFVPISASHTTPISISQGDWFNEVYQIGDALAKLGDALGDEDTSSATSTSSQDEANTGDALNISRTSL